MHIYLSKDSKLPCNSPITWNLSDYKPLVFIIYSKKNKSIVVCDNGIGMDNTDLKKFLFKVADTGFLGQVSRKDISFPSISKFGIGFVSTLIRANTINIDTKKRVYNWDKYSSEGTKVILYYNSNQAYVEELNDAEYGTKVKMNLRQSFSTEEVLEYIKTNFKCTSVDLCYIDLDKLNNVSENLINNGIEESKHLSEFTKNEFLDNIKFNKLIEIEKIIKEIDPNNLKNIYESIFFKTNRDNFSFINEKIFIATLDDDLLVNNVWIHDKKRKNMYEKNKGVLWIPITYTDYDYGIQWKSVHGFLFTNNIINRFIIKLNENEKYNEDNNNIISLSDLEDIEEELGSLDQGGYLNAMYYEKNNNDRIYDEDYKSTEIDLVYFLDDQILKTYDYEIDDLTNITIPNQKKYPNDNKKSAEVFNKTCPLISLEGDIEQIRKISSEKNFYKYVEKTAIEDSKLFYLSYDIVDMLDSYDNTMFQDGIMIPIKPNHLVPIGATRAVVNLTASSRIDLNITRNNIDESPEKLEIWMDSIASKIQKCVIEKLKDTFKDLGFDYCLSDLISVENTDLEKDYEKMALKSLRNILKDK